MLISHSMLAKLLVSVRFVVSGWLYRFGSVGLFIWLVWFVGLVGLVLVVSLVWSRFVASLMVWLTLLLSFCVSLF